MTKLSLLIKRNIYFLMMVSMVFGAWSCSQGTTRVESTPPDQDAATAQLIAYEDSSQSAFEELAHYQQQIRETLESPVPVLPLQRDLNADEKRAQEICLQDPVFLQYKKDSTGNICRNEIFGIYPARESDLTTGHISYLRQGPCYRIEMYNFALNITTIALVSLPQSKAFQVAHYVAMQPELPGHLRKLAIKLATENNHVIQALNVKPEAKDALMADTKTALNQSRCERSKHLCVAPTFVRDKKALWTVVDLTDLRVAGLRWTNLGDTPVVTSPVSERKIQNETITNCFCKTSVELQQNDWKLDYMITSNDGLRISDVNYKGKKIISNAKLVDWHVSYSKTDGFGYSDAVGCPYFSSATVVAVEAPKVVDLLEGGKKVGFGIEQFYRSEGWPSPCNYEYFQRYEFYNDGRFRISAANIGRGCGNDGTYRPVFRIALAGKANPVDEWVEGKYQPVSKEGWRLQQSNTQYDQGAMFRLTTGNAQYKLVPGNGQFRDGGRGDHAYIYFTTNKPGVDEGESDLPTIGPCCNIDFRQGPEKFIGTNPEPLANQSVVVWYVPQIKNDDTKGREYCWAEARLVDGVYQTETYPCIAGPMFVPY